MLLEHDSGYGLIGDYEPDISNSDSSDEVSYMADKTLPGVIRWIPRDMWKNVNILKRLMFLTTLMGFVFMKSRSTH